MRAAHSAPRDSEAGLPLKICDVASDFLKRHSGIVWEPGAVRGVAPRRGREEIGEPCGRTLTRHEVKFDHSSLNSGRSCND